MERAGLRRILPDVAGGERGIPGIVFARRRGNEQPVDGRGRLRLRIVVNRDAPAASGEAVFQVCGVRCSPIADRVARVAAAPTRRADRAAAGDRLTRDPDGATGPVRVAASAIVVAAAAVGENRPVHGHRARGLDAHHAPAGPAAQTRHLAAIADRHVSTRACRHGMRGVAVDDFLRVRK